MSETRVYRRRAATCHPDRPLRSRGRCNACHVQAKREPGWQPRLTGSAGHVQPKERALAPCHPNRPLTAKGMCEQCYGRDRHLRVKYGITLAEYDALLASQGGVCAMCSEPPYGKSVMHVDHNHVTGAIRGIIHSGCNRLVGAAEDPRLALAVDYVARYFE